MPVPEHLIVDFDNPPVIERALGVQFNSLPDLSTDKIVTLWNDSFREHFPRLEVQEPLNNVVESFESPQPVVPGVQIQVGSPAYRFWFLNKDRTELLQIQRNRFIHNWRKQETGSEDRRYERIMRTFRDNLTKLRDFTENEKLGDFVPTQCELTYVNEIRAGEGWENHGDLHHVFSYSNVPDKEFLPDLESANVGMRFVMRDGGKAIGRLHVTVTPKYRKEDLTPVWAIQLTARGAPYGEDNDGISKFLDLAHEWVVRGFTDVTTRKMHTIWGRKK